jgi:hypothetical protein
MVFNFLTSYVHNLSRFISIGEYRVGASPIQRQVSPPKNILNTEIKTMQPNIPTPSSVNNFH